MKISLVGTEFAGSGGIQYVNRLLLRALGEIARGTPCEIHAFSYSDSPAGLPEQVSATRDIRFHAFARNRRALGVALLRHAWSAKPHVVLFTHVRLLKLARAVRLLAPGARIAALAHGVEVWEPLPIALRRQLQAADGVVAPSEFTRDRLIEFNAVPAEKIQVLPHGLAPEFAADAASPVRDPNLALVVARLDRADTYKGVDKAIEAMPYVISRCPDAHMMIAGDGDDVPRLREIAARLNLAERVRFCGPLSGAELRGCYRRASVFVLPSTGEGFGIVFLEAMAHGLPVVAVRAAATPEVVEDGVTGILTEPGDDRALASAISGLLLVPEERARLGCAAQARVEDHFTFERFSQRWERWLAGLLPEEFYLARHAAVFAARV